MLIKLLKYDVKWVYKVVIIFNVLALIFSCIGKGLSYIENSVIFTVLTGICYGIAISMIISSFINCILRLWIRFIKNSYKDESYLTHTIPVQKKTIYASKVISALITIFITSISTILCMLICYFSEENLQFVKKILELTASTYNTTVLNLLLLISIVIMLQIIFVVIIGYVGIIIGHKSNTGKIIRSIVISFALYMATQVINLGVIYIFGLFNSNIMNLINTNQMIDLNSIKMIMYGAILLYTVYIIFYYVLGKRIFEKGVNVE